MPYLTHEGVDVGFYADDAQLPHYQRAGWVVGDPPPDPELAEPVEVDDEAETDPEPARPARKSTPKKKD